MPDIATLQPGSYATDQEKRRQAEIAANERPGLMRAIDDTMEAGWVTNALVRMASRSSLAGQGQFDPNYKLTAEGLKELGDGIPTEMLPAFEGATSYSDAQIIRQNLLNKTQAQNELASLGWKGSALSFAGQFLDPAAYAAFALTGGASGVGSAMRVGNLVKGGIVTGATTAGLEAFVSLEDPSVKATDILWAGAAGFGAHQVFSLGSAALAKAFTRTKRDIEFGDVAKYAMGAASGGELNPKTFREQVKALVQEKGGLHYFREQLDPEQLKADVHSVLDDLDMPQEMRAELRALPPEEVLDRLLPPRDATPPGLAADQAETIVPPGDKPPTAEGATPAEPPPPPLKKGDFALDGLSPARGAMTKARFSFSAIFGRSESDALRMTGSAYVKDSLNKQGGGKSVEAGSEWVNKTFSIFAARYYREAEPALRAWAAANGKPLDPIRGLKTRDEFFEEVGKTIRAPRDTFSDPHINAVANLQRDLHAETLGILTRHGAKGFDKVGENDSYLMRVWSSGRLTRAEALHGTAGVERTLTGALLRGSDIEPDKAAKLARVFLKVIRNQDKYSDVDKARMFSGDQADTLAAVLREHGMGPEEVKNIVYAVAPPAKDGNLTPRAMRRLGIDENYRDPATGLSIHDLLESNAEVLFGAYTRQALGTSAEAMIFRKMSEHFDPDGKGLKIESFDQLKSRIGEEMSNRGIAKERIESDLANLEIVRKAVVGVRLNPETTTANVLRKIRAVNFLNLSGGFGVAQLPDVGNVVASAGFRTMLQQMPALGSIFARAKSGKMSNELFEFIELSTGLGTDRIARQITSRFDEAGAMTELGGGGIDRRLRQGSRWANDLSFMSPINITLQRWSGALAAQKMANLAWAGNHPGAKRLAALGMDEGDWGVVAHNIKAHGKFEDGWLGRRLLNPNVDAWSHQEAASKFIVAIDKWSRSVVQQNDIGQMLPFMTTEAGKTIFQFRSFAISAWENQFLARVQHHDWEAFMGVAWGTMTAGLVYAGQKYVESIGRADRDEFLATHLSPRRIVTSAVQRGAWSSLLPGAIDTVWGATGGDPIFNARNSGLKSNYFTGNPTYNLIVNDLYPAVRGVGQAVRGDKPFTRQDAQHWTNMLPGVRIMGIKNLIDSFNSRLPEE